MKFRSSAALVLAVGGLAAAPSANAATVGTNASCVRIFPGVPSLPVFADGFAPGAFLTFKVDGATVGSGTTDPNGHFDNLADPNTWFTPAELQGRNKGTVQLSAEDGAGGIAGPIPVKATNVIWNTTQKRVEPSKKVRFRMFGYQTGKRIYLHIRRGNKTKGRFNMGKAKGACGLATKRMRFMPLRGYKTGTYEYWIGHSKKFDRNQAIGRQVTITRRFSAASSEASAGGAWN